MFPAADGSKPEMTPRRSLAHEFVRHVGEAVVAVVAATRDQAQDAADLVEIDYDPLPSVTDTEDALKPGAPLVWAGAPGNLAGFNRFGDAGKSDAAFKAAAHIVSLDIQHQRLIVNAMEPRAVMAEWEGDRMVVHIGSQNPSVTRDTLCDVILKMPKEQVRVVVRDIGGGFGMKTGIQPDESVAVWVAKMLKRPVKWRGRARRGIRRHHGGPRPAPQGVDGARQGRQDPGAAHGGLRQYRRLSVARRRRHPAVRRAQGHHRHLRHSRGRPEAHLRAHHTRPRSAPIAAPAGRNAFSTSSG